MSIDILITLVFSFTLSISISLLFLVPNLPLFKPPKLDTNALNFFSFFLSLFLIEINKETMADTVEADVDSIITRLLEGKQRASNESF